MTDATEAGAAGGPEPTPKHTQSAAELAAETLGHDLLEALVNEFGQATAWKGMTELQRQVVIDRLRGRVQKLLTEALEIIFVGNYPACRGVLESVTVKDGVKASLKIARTEHHLVELAEHVGTPVVLLMHDPQQYFEQMEKIRAKADQGELFDENGNLKVAVGERPDNAEAGEQASGDTADGDRLPPVADPLWMQADKALQRIGIHMDTADMQDWTEEQCTEASFWVQVVEDKGQHAPKPPKHVKPPKGWLAKGWKKAL